MMRPTLAACLLAATAFAGLDDIAFDPHISAAHVRVFRWQPGDPLFVFPDTNHFWLDLDLAATHPVAWESDLLIGDLAYPFGNKIPVADHDLLTFDATIYGGVRPTDIGVDGHPWQPATGLPVVLGADGDTFSITMEYLEGPETTGWPRRLLFQTAQGRDGWFYSSSDNFIYWEHTAAPEPSVGALMMLGTAWLLCHRRKP